jgi:hypothetical protein
MIDLDKNCIVNESIDVKLKISNELESSDHEGNSFCDCDTNDAENYTSKSSKILLEELDLVQKISNRKYTYFIFVYKY